MKHLILFLAIAINAEAAKKSVAIPARLMKQNLSFSEEMEKAAYGDQNLTEKELKEKADREAAYAEQQRLAAIAKKEQEYKDRALKILVEQKAAELKAAEEAKW